MTSRQRFLLTPDPIPLTKPFKDSDPQEPSSYFSRTQPDAQAEGEAASADHHLSKPPAALVGASPAPYPKAAGLWADEVAHSLDVSLTGLSDEALQHRRAKLQLEQRIMDPADARVAELGVEIVAIAREQDRRNQ